MKEKFVVILVFQLSSYIITFLANYILALNLDVALMGIWAYVGSFINIGFMFFDIGFSLIHYQYSGKPDFKEYFGTFFTIKVILLFLNIGLTLILITAFQLWNTIYINYILIMLFSWSFIRFTNVFIYNLKSKKKIIKSEIPQFIISSLNSLTVIFLALNISLINDPVLFLSYISFTFNTVLFFVILFVSRKNIILNKPRKDLAMKYLKDTKPLIIYSVLSVIGLNIGNLIIFSSFGEQTLAYFNLVNTYVFNLLKVITISLGEVFMVYFAQYFQKKDFKMIKSMTYSIEKYLSILFLIIAILVFTNGELIFRLFLPNYLNSVPILYFLILVPYCSAITSPYIRQMRVGERQKEGAIFDTFSLILKIFLLIVLIPNKILFFPGLGLGVWGYCIVIIIQWIIGVIGYRIFSKKYFNIRYQKRIFKHLAIAFLIVIASLLIKNTILVLLIENAYLLLITSSLIGISLFLGALYLIKELKTEDIKFFKGLINLKNYYKSFRDEL